MGGKSGTLEEVFFFFFFLEIDLGAKAVYIVIETTGEEPNI